jgi:hypothetical protein
MAAASGCSGPKAFSTFVSSLEEEFWFLRAKKPMMAADDVEGGKRSDSLLRVLWQVQKVSRAEERDYQVSVTTRSHAFVRKRS